MGKYTAQDKAVRGTTISYYDQIEEENFSGPVKSISYSGPDVTAFAYIPLTTDPTEGGTAISRSPKRQLLLGTLQTISISSTRSVGPVRVLGRTNPVGYTRGARTFAGTLVFAAVNKDPFSAIYRPDMMESVADSTTSLFIDQLPPFNVHLTMVNEVGDVAVQVLYDLTLLNYGTTYSVDDLYTEVTYTYVARDATPLLPQNVRLGLQPGHAVFTPMDLVAQKYPQVAEGVKPRLFTVRQDRLDSFNNASADESTRSNGLTAQEFWGREVQLEKNSRRLPPGRWPMFRYF